MSTPQTAATNSAYKRRLRNLLLDARFQLKFASYIVGITVILSAVLGVYLWRTTTTLFAQAQGAVDARSKAAECSRELGTCALNNDLANNLDNPEFTAQLQARSDAIDKAYEGEKNLVIAQKAELVKQQQVTAVVLVAVMFAFIAFVGFGTIGVTHRIVGPLFRVKRMAAEVAEGKIRPPTYGLRPGDELKDVFDAFSNMVARLRERQAEDLQQLHEALKDKDWERLEKLRAKIQERLDRQ